MTSVISIFRNVTAALTCDMTARNASGERVLIWFHALCCISTFSREPSPYAQICRSQVVGPARGMFYHDNVLSNGTQEYKTGETGRTLEVQRQNENEQGRICGRFLHTVKSCQAAPATLGPSLLHLCLNNTKPLYHPMWLHSAVVVLCASCCCFLGQLQRALIRG